MLSSRLPKDLTPSPFFAELEHAKADVLAECAISDALPFIDMTVSSPLRVGLPFDLAPAVELAKSEFGTTIFSNFLMLSSFSIFDKNNSSSNVLP